MDRRILGAAIVAGTFLLGTWLFAGLGLRLPSPEPEPIIMPANPFMIGDAWPSEVDMCWWFGDWCFASGAPAGHLDLAR